jgi:predicted RNA-binding Zn-ribbon protein involved in translation (DUF1610 family)
MEVNMSKYKFRGHVIKPSGSKGKCGNCGKLVILRKTYVNKNDEKDVIERCSYCDEFENEVE